MGFKKDDIRKVKIIQSNPIDGQSGLEEYVGQEFETIPLSNRYDKEIADEMRKLGEVIVILPEDGKEVKRPSILNKDEYIALA